MIGIAIEIVPPTVSPMPDKIWWSRPRELCLGQQWIYDFFKNSVDNNLIVNMVYEDPVDYQDYNTTWNSLYFSSTMDTAQAWINSPELLQVLTYFRDNGFTLTVTLQENIEFETFLNSDNMTSPIISDNIFFAQPWSQ